MERLQAGFFLVDLLLDVEQAADRPSPGKQPAELCDRRLRRGHPAVHVGLLNVQEQINQEEASLEALQSQQRALARETTYATISLMVTRTAPPPARSRHHQAGAGFLRGLTAGWHALRTAVTWLLTLAGAMLPFLVPAGLVAVAAIVGRRWWLGRRRASASPAAD